MKPRTNGVSRDQKSKHFHGEGPNWVLITGGALLSTLSIHLGFKLKQLLDPKQQERTSIFKGKGKSADGRKLSGYSNVYSFAQNNDGCFNSIPGSDGTVEIKHPHDAQMLTESDMALPLVTVPAPEFHKGNDLTWASSPDRIELPPKPFHHSNCSDSPCVSESGSDIFSKREVIHKLRQQLKRRDDMILEMQDEIVDLQNSLNSQLARSTHLQSLFDAAHSDLFASEREIQRLRKAIADHCVGHVGTDSKPATVNIWASEARNGLTNGYYKGGSNFVSQEKGDGDGKRIEMLKREVGDLKEVLDGKEYVLQNYKEQKAELSVKIKELQQKLDYQLPNIL